jgi:acetoin utilization protein AcuC
MANAFEIETIQSHDKHRNWKNEGLSLTQTVGIIYSDVFQKYDFGPTHPLKPTRLKLTFELMRAVKLLSSSNVIVSEPRQANREELLLFHEEEYLELVRRMSESGEGYLDMGDTPAFKGCYEASALGAGASLEAVDLVMSGKVAHAMNIAGGLHHAHRNRASGFCIFNDPAISIAYLKRRYEVKKILYLDVDAHHGDGVMYGFYSDPSLLDIDFHEDGHHLFPGTGFTDEIGEGEASGLKVNVPLSPFTDDNAYLELFRQIVPQAVRKYRPEILLLQCGADSHANDLLAHLQITTTAYREIAETVHTLAHEVARGRLVVFGGGGYNIANVARTWTIVGSVLAGFNPLDSIPESWQRLFEALVGEKAPDRMETNGEAAIGLSQDKTLRHSVDILQDLKRRIPLLTQK